MHKPEKKTQICQINIDYMGKNLSFMILEHLSGFGHSETKTVILILFASDALKKQT